jgi:hypothetical protein
MQRAAKRIEVAAERRQHARARDDHFLPHGRSGRCCGVDVIDLVGMRSCLLMLAPAA